jgi:hypothetical protein
MPRHTHERDVVFTPFMLRVRSVTEGRNGHPVVAVTASEERPMARVVDDWFNLRIRAEHVIAEANAMIDGRTPLFDIVDEAGTGRLAFTLRRLDRWATFHIDERDRRARLVMERPEEAPGAGPVEPVDRDVLEELVIDMLCDKES